MTDKVQKIREWVKARLDENNSKQSIPQFYGMMEEDARFLDFLDTMQEEPVSDELEKVVEEIVDPTVLNAYGVKDIANRLRRTIQAEKDLALTWEDIKLIIDIVDSENLKPHLFDEIDYQEVLNRFNKQKGK